MINGTETQVTVNAINAAWCWSAFLIGAFGTFIMEFIRIIRDDKSLTEIRPIGGAYLRNQNINKLAMILIVIYILIGGTLSGVLAKTVMEAFLYGVFWEAIFIIAISNGGK